MTFTISRIQSLNLGPWTLNAKLTQFSTMSHNEIFTPKIQALGMVKENINLLDPTNPGINLRSVFEYPTTFNFQTANGSMRKGANWLKDALVNTLYNHSETRLDISYDGHTKDLASIFSLASLGQYTTISLKKAKKKTSSKQMKHLDVLISALKENTTLQHLELPEDTDEKQKKRVEKILARNRAKAKLSRWYTNPFKQIPLIVTLGISAGLALMGIPVFIILNLAFLGDTLLNGIENARQNKFLSGHKKLHPRKNTVDTASDGEKATYEYSHEAGKGWFPYVKTCLRHPIGTTWNYSAYLTGMAEQLEKSRAASTPKPR